MCSSSVQLLMIDQQSNEDGGKQSLIMSARDSDMEVAILNQHCSNSGMCQLQLLTNDMTANESLLFSWRGVIDSFRGIVKSKLETA